MLGAYEEVSRRWASTVKALLGYTPGELNDYEKWLSSIRTLRSVRRSMFSGEEVVFSHSSYPPGSKSASHPEIDFSKRYPPLDLDSLKDIDSIIEAIGERVFYTGNLVLGNSQFVEKSSGIMDSNYMYSCDRCAHTRYAAYSTMAIYSECMFGVTGSGNSQFVIGGGSNMFVNRCIEASKCDYSSDCHYSHGLSGCQECLFSFSLRSKRYCIGNLELPREKYLRIKEKLLEELAQVLEKEKRLPRLLDIVASEKPDYAQMRTAMESWKPKPKAEDRKGVEAAFANTSRLVLGTSLNGIDGYERWLSRNVNPIYAEKSCASGEQVLVPEHSNFVLFPKDRLVSLEESFYLGDELKFTPTQAESFSLAEAGKSISAIAYLSPDWNMGNTHNVPSCVVSINSSDCYRCVLPLNSKQCAVYYWPRDSEQLFGGNEVRSSSFCMNCFHSERLTRCFEVDSSWNCSDCYFCHNCENVHNSMFCFNAKNLRNAIGNVPVPPEKYARIKTMVLAEINSELARTKGFSKIIFSV